jgi:CRP-like cAMP-binding protein/rhodanese-related sulfurtransferase
MTDAVSSVANLQGNCHVFSDLPERYLIELESEGSIRTYRLDAGDSLTIRGRSEVNESLVLLEGGVIVKENGATIAAGSTQELRCHSIPIRGASTEVVATSGATICRLEKDKLDYLIGWSAMLNQLPPEDVLVHSRLQRLRYPSIFMNLPLANVTKAFRQMGVRQVKPGEEIIRQGEQGDLFFIIESGRAEVWQSGVYDDEQKLVGVRGPGDHVGDEALVSGGKRNATVRMIEDGTVLTLSKKDFRELISEPMVNEVEIPVAKALAAQGHQFVDVRYKEEWEDGHIPGATLLPLTDIRERMNELDRNGKFITYCLSGKRSAVAAMILKAKGFDAVCMKDGLRDWPDETVTD